MDNNAYLKKYTSINTYIKEFDYTLDLSSLSVIGKIEVVAFYRYMKYLDKLHDTSTNVKNRP